MKQGADASKAGEAVNVVTADQVKKEGKGRYAIEFGQSATFDKNDTFAGKGNGVADTAKKAVQLTVPNKTASNMAQGVYNAKITWSVVTAQ